MRDLDDGTTEGPTETLQAGPSRPPLLGSVPAGWRQGTGAVVAFVLGVCAGVGTLQWWQDEPTPPPRVRADVHDVELVLFEAVPPRDAGPGALRVKGALLLSGAVTSTVVGIELLGETFEVRAPQLPLTVSASARLRSIDLSISVRDCERAMGWEPADRPFTITWRDGVDRSHTDRAGDFDRAMSTSLVRYVEGVCAGSAVR